MKVQKEGVIMKKYMCILMVFVASVMSTSAFGALDVDQQAWNSTINPISTSHYIGQGFVQGAGLTSLDEIRVMWYDYYGDSGPWSSALELHTPQVSATYDATSLIATSLTNSTYVGQFGPGNPALWASYTFDGGAAVTPGDGYTFILKHSSGKWAPALSTTDPYNGATSAVINNNGSGDAYTNHWGYDLAFQTYSTPEPATMSLLGLGGIALLRKRRA